MVYYPSVASVLPTGDPVKNAATLLSAISRLPSTGGTVIPGPGDWPLPPGALDIKVADSETIVIDGEWGARFRASGSGSGDVIRMRDPNGQTSGLFAARSGVKNLFIDGTGSAAGVTGLRIGDIAAPQVDVVVSNFAQASSTGLAVENASSWTEQADMRAVAFNCTRHVDMVVSTGNPSFAYGNFDFTVIAQSNQQDGVAIRNGAFVYNCPKFGIRGDHTSGASPTTAVVLRMAGVNASGGPSNGKTCVFVGNNVQIQMESGGGANPPGTIFMDQANFAYAAGNYGIMNWTSPGEAPAFAAASFGNGQFTFSGDVNGDPAFPVFNPGYPAWVNFGQPQLYAAVAGFGAGLASALSDFSPITLAANAVITLNEGNPTAALPQRFTAIITQAASGGPYTVTWPHNASPTNASPTVKWAGGSAPAMSAGAGAVDVYDLQTLDGATWYGRATQNVS
jgi:hypothetical protein